jgi:hypothetical protein
MWCLESMKGLLAQDDNTEKWTGDLMKDNQSQEIYKIYFKEANILRNTYTTEHSHITWTCILYRFFINIPPVILYINWSSIM